MNPSVLDDHAHVQVGDSLPSVDVHEGTPSSTVNVKELFAGKKGVLFGVPGAFTPGCSKVRLHTERKARRVFCRALAAVDGTSKMDHDVLMSTHRRAHGGIETNRIHLLPGSILLVPSTLATDLDN